MNKKINNSPNDKAIRRTLKIMSTRGPDDKNYFVKNINTQSLALLHSRLSIIDPSKKASQPFMDKDGVLIFNGAIYNYLELRQQILNDFPPKELRSVIDQGKKDITKGIIVSISTFEEKVGVAVGITNDLISKYDAVILVKIASEILGGKGGGGRKDFAQAGGINKNKIDDAFKAIVDKIS